MTLEDQRAKNKAYHAKRYAANRGKILAKNAAYYAANREKEAIRRAQVTAWLLGMDTETSSGYGRRIEKRRNAL